MSEDFTGFLLGLCICSKVSKNGLGACFSTEVTFIGFASSLRGAVFFPSTLGVHRSYGNSIFLAGILVLASSLPHCDGGTVWRALSGGERRFSTHRRHSQAGNRAEFMTRVDHLAKAAAGLQTPLEVVERLQVAAVRERVRLGLPQTPLEVVARLQVAAVREGGSTRPAADAAWGGRISTSCPKGLAACPVFFRYSPTWFPRAPFFRRGRRCRI